MNLDTLNFEQRAQFRAHLERRLQSQLTTDEERDVIEGQIDELNYLDDQQCEYCN